MQVGDKVMVTIRYPNTEEYYGSDRVYEGSMQDVMLEFGRYVSKERMNENRSTRHYFKTLEGHSCHPDGKVCCASCLKLNGYDTLDEVYLTIVCPACKNEYDCIEIDFYNVVDLKEQKCTSVCTDCVDEPRYYMWAELEELERSGRRYR